MTTADPAPSSLEEGDCKIDATRDALMDLYKPALERMQRVLTEIRSSQESVMDAMEDSQDNMIWTQQLESVMQKVSALPAYAARAQKVSWEMKALRLRMDRAKQRAQALQMQVQQTHEDDE